MQENRQEADPEKVKIAVVSDKYDTATVARLVSVLTEKGYEVVPVEQATHTLDDEGIDQFLLAEKNRTKDALRQTQGLRPRAKKKLWKDKRKQLGREAFGRK